MTFTVDANSEEIQETRDLVPLAPVPQCAVKFEEAEMPSPDCVIPLCDGVYHCGYRHCEWKAAGDKKQGLRYKIHPQ